jgi:hypothetical protein
MLYVLARLIQKIMYVKYDLYMEGFVSIVLSTASRHQDFENRVSNKTTVS